MIRKVDLRFPVERKDEHSCSPRPLSVRKKGLSLKSQSPSRPLPKRNQKKYIKNIIDCCCSRLELSLTLIKSVEHKIQELKPHTRTF